MRWLMNVLKALLALVVVLGVVGLLLPRQRHVERSIDVAATPAQIWPLLAEPKRWTSWSPWYAKDPTMKLVYSGPEAGAGAGWAWESQSQGHGSMRFEDAQPPTRLGYTLRFDDMGSTATGEFLLVPQGSTATRVTWAFDTDLGLNPVARWFGLAMDRLVGPDFDSGLAKLATQAQNQAQNPTQKSKSAAP
jgi:carbon monoxide dehydrogenase subunit G